MSERSYHGTTSRSLCIYIKHTSINVRGLDEILEGGGTYFIYAPDYLRMEWTRERARLFFIFSFSRWGFVLKSYCFNGSKERSILFNNALNSFY